MNFGKGLDPFAKGLARLKEAAKEAGQSAKAAAADLTSNLTERPVRTRLSAANAAINCLNQAVRVCAPRLVSTLPSVTRMVGATLHRGKSSEMRARAGRARRTGMSAALNRPPPEAMASPLK